MDLEAHPRRGCKFDFLRIYDGPSSSSPLLHEICGTQLPGSITSTGSSMLVEFISDDEFAWNGFIARYTYGTIMFHYLSYIRCCLFNFKKGRNFLKCLSIKQYNSNLSS